jgi:hypothetical protein
MKHSFSPSAVCGLATAGLLCGASSLFAADACCAKPNPKPALATSNAITLDTRNAEATPYAGHWALTLPGGGAGWLGVAVQDGGTLKGSLLWGGGSVLPVAETKVEGGALVVVRKHSRKKNGKNVQFTETLTAKLDGDKLAFTTRTVDDEGKEVGKADFSGKKIPDLPPRPDLTKVKFGAPVPLLNGKDMTGWKAMNEKAPNCWGVADGVLSNRVKGPDGKNRHGTNIRTEAEFEDFNLKTDVRMLPGGNSGIYLRGIYEVQMADTYGRPLDPHNMGALYSRITPAVAAERPAGEWQSVDITLVDRHLTVILNGKTIIDNQPVLGCTGGALTSDEFKPGPIYLQGDHTDVDYRGMVLTPVVKK